MFLFRAGFPSQLGCLWQTNRFLLKRSPLSIPRRPLQHQIFTGQKRLFAGGPKGKKIEAQVYNDLKIQGVPSIGNMEVFRFVLKYMWPKDQPQLQLRVGLAILVLVLAKILNVQVPVFFKHIVDALTPTSSEQSNLNSLRTPEQPSPPPSTSSSIFSMDLFSLGAMSVGSVILGYAIARGAAAGLSELKNALFSKVTQRAVRKISLGAFDGLHWQGYQIHSVRSTGSVTRIVERGTRGIQFLVSSLVFNVGPTVLEVGLVAGMLGTQFGTVFAATTLGCVSSYAAATIFLTKWRTRIRKEMNLADNKAAGVQLDSLINYESVKYFSGEVLESFRYNNALKKYEGAAIKTSTSLALLNTTQSLILSGSLGAIMSFSALAISSGSMTVGELVMANSLLFQLSIPLNFLGTVYREITQATLDLKSMVSVLNTSKESSSIGHTALSPTSKITIENTEGMHKLSKRGPINGEIVVNDLYFKYDLSQTNSAAKSGPTSGSNISGGGERMILNGISFSIPLGSSVAFVGTSGSGKSTLARLLFGLLKPTSGSIHLQLETPGLKKSERTRIDLAHGGVQLSRKYIGVIPQDPILFNESITYNIAYPYLADKYNEHLRAGGTSDTFNAREVVNACPVENAASLASADDFIERLDHGYNTSVGERGIRLSGGERQRIAIARALVRDPPILLLDEATSALDTNTERAVLQNLSANHRRTLVYIAHRLSTIEHCDMIFVLNKGRLVESGTHAHLKSINGIYASMLAPTRPHHP